MGRLGRGLPVLGHDLEDAVAESEEDAMVAAVVEEEETLRDANVG